MNEQVQRVIGELEAFMPTVDDALALPRASAAFVHAVVLARRPMRAVEIGTSYGYSGLWTAAALPAGGQLFTIDRLEHKHEAARQYFAKAGLMDRVQLLTGEAEALLADVPGPIDFVLNDADKPQCVAYIESLLDRLSDHAVVLTDNIDSHAEALAPFVSWVRSRPEFFSTPVPVGSGMELSVRREATGNRQ